MRFVAALLTAIVLAACATSDTPLEGERLTVFTHCGFYEVVYDGLTWTPESIDRGAFPPGTDSLATPGIARRVGDKLVFVADSGLEVTFAQAPPDLPPPPPCD